MNDLTALSKRVYQFQIEKGWCKPDEKRDIENLKILILSEAFEAFEAYRGNNYSQLSNAKLRGLLMELGNHTQHDECLGDFKGFVKDTFEDEIADVAIRALDLAGYLGLNFQESTFDDIGSYQIRVINEKYPKLLSLLNTYISNCIHVSKVEDKVIRWFDFELPKNQTGHSFVLNILSWCKTIAKIFEFDLMQHIELKLAYNKTRPFRHGNKVV